MGIPRLANTCKRTFFSLLSFAPLLFSGRSLALLNSFIFRAVALTSLLYIFQPTFFRGSCNPTVFDHVWVQYRVEWFVMGCGGSCLLSGDYTHPRAPQFSALED